MMPDPMNTNPPPIFPPPPPPVPLGGDPDDAQPVPTVAAAIEALLKHPRRLVHALRQPGTGAALTGRLLVVTLACALLYGVVMGSFSGGAQWWAAPLKLTAGLLFAALICLPSLYIFACLAGCRAGVREMAGLLAAMLALATLLLVGFAPVAWVFSQSTARIPAMGALHVLFWLVAALFGLRGLVAGAELLEARRGGLLWLWAAIFLLVTLQMSTALRPLVGTAETLLPTEKRFFLEHWFGGRP